MTRVFDHVYARSYDGLYGSKDYAQECDYLEEAFRRFAEGPVRTVLDLGCGTGNHALALAAREYRPVGVDLSPAMLEIARQKATAAGRFIPFIAGDIRSFEVEGQFDAAVFMFAVLGYLTETADVLRALKRARAAIRTGGVLAFDVWNGPAVLALRPLERSRIIGDDARMTIRLSHPTLRSDRNLVDVRLRLWELSSRAVEHHADETHSVRYFFQPELSDLLERSGFQVIRYAAFPLIDTPPSDTSWDLGCIAIAI